MAVLRRNGTDASNTLQDGGNGGIHADYQALVDILPVGIFTLDVDRKIQSINPAASQVVGWARDEALGKTCRQLLQCSYCGDECAARQAQATRSTRRAFPAEIRRPDGSLRSIMIDAVPLETNRVAVLVRDVTESEKLRRAIQDRWIFHGLVCVAESSKEIVGQIRDVAPYDSTVLILGESGTGKELVARALHAESPRAAKPFVVVNCAAYSETLLESELFGHVRGSFTGAHRDRRGRFELAEGGTVLLDEIGEISPKIQVKLLRVLQEREIERVGESRSRKVDIRVLASTNRDLHREVREGRFREDLYYRLNVFTIDLPPLRERKEDVPALTDYLIERLAERTGKNVRGVRPEVMTTLLAHAWPGNVRELENVLESAVVRARTDVITSVDVPRTTPGPAHMTQDDRMRDALKRTGGCVTRAARLLGVHRTTLWRRMRETGIERSEFMEG